MGYAIFIRYEFLTQTAEVSSLIINILHIHAYLLISKYIQINGECVQWTHMASKPENSKSDTT